MCQPGVFCVQLVNKLSRPLSAGAALHNFRVVTEQGEPLVIVQLV